MAFDPTRDTRATSVTIAAVLDAARPAYDRLLERAGEVEDEWSYVNDLTDAWRTRLDEVAAHRGDDEPSGRGQRRGRPAPSTRSAAIEDPHRAIDWLSTFPQVVLVALGERP